MRPLIPRNLTRSLSPAKLLLAFFLFVLYVYFPFHNAQPPSILDNPESQERLAAASLAELVDIYEQVRSGILDHQHYNSSAVASRLRAPVTLPDGSPNFDPRLANYVDRLRRFVDEYFRNTPNHIIAGARGALKDVIRRAPPQSRPDAFPAKVWSTHPSGNDGVEAGFDLWRSLLPLPLSRKLVKELSPRQDLGWLKPAREGQPWEVIVTDDDGLDRWVSEWTSERISRGIQGEGKWSKLWGGLDRGVLRADLFRYVSMFVAGGIYSDSDTMPISHPYLWGLNAPSILHKDIETLITLINKALTGEQDPSIKDRLNPRSTMPNDTTASIITPNDTTTPHEDTIDRYTDDRYTDQTYTPPYSRPSRRAPIVPLGEVPATILNPEISIIVAIEWDSMIGRTLGMWRSWTWFRLTRSWPDCCFPRGLEMVQNLLVSKPFHPIMLDTLATISELVDSGVAKQLSPLDLTGPGPFTDAVFRYLLVQYGVTPDDLRSLRGPVRVGDVLILQEEAWHAPEKAIRRLLSHVQSIGSSVMGGRSGRDPWLFGQGWEDWQSGGKKVAYHGLTGIVSEVPCI
ncbi:alpha-1,6-mannosyltransferase [Kwoniella heveanensis BCC8398]|uniref:Alpha-1,6-mannosyltransferase n=1 Tax=Kwoniella heveanensis BCC8398 TaxID=1296120 RepID=A0A1B9H413_9TREE|nr:alpha-1,6-mannosyltransferase [Kwoniella heveanensis BCC8398]